MVYAVAVHDNSIPSLRRQFVYHLFMTFAFGMIAGLLVTVPYYIWGNWRSKGVTAQAKNIGK